MPIFEKISLFLFSFSFFSKRILISQFLKNLSKILIYKNFCRIDNLIGLSVKIIRRSNRRKKVGKSRFSG